MASSALLLLDLQNDFLHSNGAYGRAGQSSPEIAALPARLKPLTDLLRKEGGLIGVTFKVEGKLDAPSLMINPLSAITPGIFRKIFEFPVN
jgi:nicotinamidase-related amidase